MLRETPYKTELESVRLYLYVRTYWSIVCPVVSLIVSDLRQCPQMSKFILKNYLTQGASFFAIAAPATQDQQNLPYPSCI
jgi:hypothetical protein